MDSKDLFRTYGTLDPVLALYYLAFVPTALLIWVQNREFYCNHYSFSTPKGAKLGKIITGKSLSAGPRSSFEDGIVKPARRIKIV